MPGTVVLFALSTQLPPIKVISPSQLSFHAPKTAQNPIHLRRALAGGYTKSEINQRGQFPGTDSLPTGDNFPEQGVNLKRYGGQFGPESTDNWAQMDASPIAHYHLMRGPEKTTGC